MKTASKKPTATIECPKCNGAGRISAFAHIESGSCFRCGGAGTIKAPRARRLAVILEEPKASEQLPKFVVAAERMVANSPRGISEHCAYSMRIVAGIKQHLASLEGPELDTWTAKFSSILGRDAHLLAA